MSCIPLKNKIQLFFKKIIMFFTSQDVLPELHFMQLLIEVDKHFLFTLSEQVSSKNFVNFNKNNIY